METGNNARSAASENPTPAFSSLEKRQKNKFSLKFAILASTVSLLLGYNIGAMIGGDPFIVYNLNLSNTQADILIIIINLFAAIGSVAAGRTSDWIGRRFTFTISAVILFIGSIILAFAQNYATLLVGRSVAGIGVGYALMVAPVYTVEISPALSRGFLTSFPEFFTNVGIFLAYICIYFVSRLSDELSWRLMLGLGAIPSIILAFSFLRLPESPRWLVMQGRLSEAKNVLVKIYDSEEEAVLRLIEIKPEAGITENYTEDEIAAAVGQKRSNGGGVWKELFLHPSPSIRRILIASVGVLFLQQASGIDAVALYTPQIIQRVGLEIPEILGGRGAVGFCKTCFVLISAFLADRIGRRRLLLTSVAGMVVSLLGLGVGLKVAEHYPDKPLPWAIALCIATVLSYAGFFSIGLGPTSWVYCSEAFPLRLRAEGVSVAAAVNRATSAAIMGTFRPLSNGITTGGTIFVYAGIASAGWVFLYIMLSDTQGKRLEELGAVFRKADEPVIDAHHNRRERNINGQIGK
ncbi:PREDICTED: putative polyol transporter 1 [Nelumbo nucifera]|uniref:Major facilitator superfamily (MFS) profile domain-containing protein n=2 Tax=Nelumbo nucifera TaxID=4432 RepID=A0A822XRX2_NELNU|nr:PREDICTED: putative polyol transporter 1 [Nelumbo nucifera]DAD21716.1 TPA_asm: hypothetical protein HUJ06_023179 [Nelumbo nucifera]